MKTVNQTETVVIIKSTSYHYYRNFIKPLFDEKGLEGFKFVKSKDSWKGKVEVPKKDEKKYQKHLLTLKENNVI
ncbi:MAG: hypothetical protein EOO06_00245 [Chitinophagaceae bacterium]|nr:MAG: hypothetical protein EOO06_00245 [Chitinophagaceae bacterium]